MIVDGVFLGPHGFDLLDQALLHSAADLRMLALYGNELTIEQRSVRWDRLVAQSYCAGGHR